MQDKGRELVSVKDFYRPDLGDATNDYAPALSRAIAAGKREIYYPPGSYNHNSVVEVQTVENIRIFGLGGMFPDDEGGARITCNNGFIKNSATGGSTARRRVEVSGLSLKGNRTPGAKGIAGPFGGIFRELYIDGFDVGIENPSAFLCDYDRITFGGSNATTGGGLIALSLADCNGTSVTRCSFAAYWQKHISTVDVTPMTGSDNGMAIHLYRNNHNASGNVYQGNSLITVSGNIFGACNYFEASPATTNWLGKFLDVKVNGFGDYGLTWINNEMNGGGSDGALNAIYLNGTRTGAIPNPCGGEIYGNRLLGFAADRPHIAFGPNNCIVGLKIHDNMPFDGADAVIVSNRHARSMHKPMATGWSATTVALDGTWKSLNISTNQPVDNSDALASNTFSGRKYQGAYYWIDCEMVGGTGRMRFAVNGVSVLEPTHNTSRLAGFVWLAYNDSLAVQATGSGTVTGTIFNAECKEDGHS